MLQQTARGNQTKQHKTMPDVEILDEAEQERIAAELQKAAVDQARSTRFAFSVVFSLLACIMVIVLTYSILMPMRMHHQAVFDGIIHHHYFLAFYIVSVFVFVSCAWYLNKVSLSLKLYPSDVEFIDCHNSRAVPDKYPYGDLSVYSDLLYLKLSCRPSVHERLNGP
jgi:hypothetical protein